MSHIHKVCGCGCDGHHGYVSEDCGDCLSRERELTEKDAEIQALIEQRDYSDERYGKEVEKAAATRRELTELREALERIAALPHGTLHCEMVGIAQDALADADGDAL